MNVVYFSVTSNEIPNLSEACMMFRKNIGNIEIYARTRTQLDENSAMQEVFVQKALVADLVFVTLMAGSKSCPAWDQLIDALSYGRNEKSKKPWFHIQPTGSNPESLDMVQQMSDGLEDDTWTTLSRYYRYGGVDNLLQMLSYVHNRIHGGALPVTPPLPQPYEGLYHPDRGWIESKEAYLAALDPLKPTVGIWFYQNFFTSNNKAHIDAMIQEAEKKGANVICVFHMRFKDSVFSCPHRWPNGLKPRPDWISTRTGTMIFPNRSVKKWQKTGAPCPVICLCMTAACCFPV